MDPDSTHLSTGFLSHFPHLWQVDTWAPDLQTGLPLIADYDGFLWKDFSAPVFS